MDIENENVIIMFAVMLQNMKLLVFFLLLCKI